MMGSPVRVRASALREALQTGRFLSAPQAYSAGSRRTKRTVPPIPRMEDAGGADLRSVRSGHPPVYDCGLDDLARVRAAGADHSPLAALPRCARPLPSGPGLRRERAIAPAPDD